MAMPQKTGTRKQIGEIGVDAGLCWVGDPCYILHADPMPKAIGKDWPEFCEKLRDRTNDDTNTWQFNYDLGHPGLGVMVSTGYGDGTYPVFVEFAEDGRIASVTVEFIGPDEDETDEEE